VSERPAPLHPFEVRINIGANDRSYIVDTLLELAQHFESGNDSGLASGGWSGSHSVTVAKRDITPEAYRAELEQWSQQVIQKHPRVSP
jgi:hypothetical protein